MLKTRLTLASMILCLAAAPSAAAQRTIRWVLAHEPAGVFAEAAEEFARLVSAETNGELAVKVISPREYFGERRVDPDEVAEKVAAGDVEMTQTYTTSLSRRANKLLVLDMPFLFRDHRHAAKVLDGAIGRDLLASLSPAGMRGLAFTYSGGYRILPTTSREIHGPEDVKGLRVRTTNSPVAKETLKVLGAEPVPAYLEDIVPMAKSGRIDAAESTLPRYADGHHDLGVPVINETNHSLFVTAVLINGKFYDSLSPAHRRAVSRAALKMARIERDRSVKDGEAVVSKAREEGAKVVELDEAGRERFAKAVTPVYERFEPVVGDMVSRIRKTR